MSEDVILGGARFSWLQDLSEDEILRWPELPPSFPDDMPIVRDRARRELGRVDVPPIWNGAHSEIRRLLRTDVGRQERQRRTSVVFPWEAPRFDFALGQRQLRILNAIFLCVVRAGGKGQVGSGDRIKPRVVVHGSPVAFRLIAVEPETKKPKRGVSPSADPANRLQLTILSVQGSNPELVSWEDEEGAPLETRITDIAVELIATAEINYREASIRRHLWVSEKREAIRKRMAEDKRVAEVAARANAVAVGKARLDKAPAGVALPIRSRGMSEHVVLGGSHFSWLHGLSDPEILRWPEHPPSFPDDMDIVRDRVRSELGRVDVPPTWDGAHSERHAIKSPREDRAN
jgi:hypothetical protein